MIKILEQRDKAAEALGDKFSLQDFHYTILSNGMLPLEFLEALTNQYIEAHL